jgi:arylsulfatase A-like enzyme
MTLVILVADGVRADTLFAAMDAGQLPALARLRREGSAHTITSVFPSVTGPAYTPFLLGLHPGRAGVPGIRWWDRARDAVRGPGGARSYVGFEALRQDRDLVPDHRTLFEFAERPLGALTPIGRGLRGSRRMGTGLAFGFRMGWTHFRGDVPGWLRLDRAFAERVTSRVARERPDVTFFAHPGIDKISHQRGHTDPAILDAMRIVDETAARLRDDAGRGGWGDELEIWVVSDHGHSPVRRHEDLAGLLSGWGLGVIAHPWVFTGGTDAAVMVSGNAMAHVYLELRRRSRPWWPALRERWGSMVERLLERESVDLVLLPHSADHCEIHARGRGMATVSRDAAGRYRYATESGDPLGLASALGSAGAVQALSADEVHALTFDTDYPDSLVQIIALAGARRSGEILLSAARQWDFRAKYEPTPHVSSHGALHREHLLVPLIVSRPVSTLPRRTVDVLPSALRTLGIPVPRGLDGTSFR